MHSAHTITVSAGFTSLTSIIDKAIVTSMIVIQTEFQTKKLSSHYHTLPHFQEEEDDSSTGSKDEVESGSGSQEEVESRSVSSSIYDENAVGS